MPVPRRKKPPSCPRLWEAPSLKTIAEGIIIGVGTAAILAGGAVAWAYYYSPPVDPRCMIATPASLTFSIGATPEQATRAH